MKKITLTLTLILFILQAFGQSPSAFNYQAVLRDATGNIKTNANVAIRIDLLQSTATGTVVYAESFAATTNVLGLINLQVGKGTVISGTFSAINWANGPYYIKVNIDGIEMGTSQLLSVPYAMFAGNGFSGNYADLTNKPSLFNGTWNSLTGKPTFSTVATTGSYPDLLNKPALFNGNYDSLTNKPVILNNSLKNTAVGYQSLNTNSSGRYNTALGYQTLYSNVSGLDNTAVGLYALYTNVSGYYNTAVGSSSLTDNTTGKGNTSVGCGAQMFNTIGNYNTAVGFHALLNNSGNDNTAVGYRALYSSTSGSWNVAIGDSALYSNTNSSKSTAIGYKSLVKSTGWDNTATGYQSLKSNTSGFDNVAFGVDALNSNTTGNGNTAVGKAAMFSNKTGENNTAIGFGTDVTDGITNATVIGYYATVNASNKVVIGNGDVKSIGGYAPWTNYSDARLKENIAYSNRLGLNFIMKLKPATYNYKADSGKRQHNGLIAQDVQQTIKDLGINFSGLIVDDNKDKTLNLAYAEFVLPLITAMQEQQKLIEAQQKAITELIVEVDKLKAAK